MFMDMIVQLSGFETADIEDIGRDRMFSNRKDLKYLFSSKQLPEMLQSMQEHYVLMKVNGESVHQYSTHYFDTPDLFFYRCHHNGRQNRLKVRCRYYADGTGFAEVKGKTNRGVTEKKRILIEKDQGQFSFDEMRCKELGLTSFQQLQQQLVVGYKRLTFFNKKIDEKVTIDTALTYRRGDQTEFIGELVIAESKGLDHERSTFNQMIKESRIKRSSFSKYCYGITLLEPSIKMNNFKSLHHKINKLIQPYEFSSTDPQL